MTRRSFVALLLSLVSWASTRLRGHQNAQNRQDKSEETGETGLFEVVCLDRAGLVFWRGTQQALVREIVFSGVTAIGDLYVETVFIRSHQGWYSRANGNDGGTRIRFSWHEHVWVYREAGVQPGDIWRMTNGSERTP